MVSIKKLILVIHTDEFVINFQTLKPVLEIHEFKKTNQITKAYLLFSYEPEIGHFPYIQLKIATVCNGNSWIATTVYDNHATTGIFQKTKLLQIEW